MNEKILEKILDISERFFKTENDLEQLPVTKESFYKLQRLHPKTVLCRLEDGEPVSWVVVLPTSYELADQFLKGEISERELLNATNPQNTYEALYLCAAFTMPEYRRKGYAIEMFKEAIESIPHVSQVRLFAWPFTKEGEKMLEKLQSVLDLKISRKASNVDI